MITGSSKSIRNSFGLYQTSLKIGSDTAEMLTVSKMFLEILANPFNLIQVERKPNRLQTDSNYFPIDRQNRYEIHIHCLTAMNK